MKLVPRLLFSCKQVTDHCVQIDNKNAMQLIGGYDLVLDCSDNPATRYLINDSCVLAAKTLVSASALRWEGQLTVYNDRQGGPCYRCLYPTPPNPKFVTNCSDGGVLGVGKSIRFHPLVTPNMFFFFLLFLFFFSARPYGHAAGDGSDQNSAGDKTLLHSETLDLRRREWSLSCRQVASQTGQLCRLRR